jgi:hypothetical protein
MGAITEKAKAPFTLGDQEMADIIEQVWGRDVLDNPRLGFNHLIQTSCFLPGKDPGEIPMWQRKDGGLTMTMTRGPAMNPVTREAELQGYPFGLWPRRFHSIINAEILRSRSRTIYCGRGFCEFFRGKMPVRMTGGANGNIRHMKNQFSRLSAANLVFFMQNDKRIVMLSPARMIEATDMWLEGNEEHWPSFLLASQAYCEDLFQNAVPINLLAAARIKGSLEYDFYTWVTRRVYSLVVKNQRSVVIPWYSLKFTMGYTYAAMSDFQKEIRAIITHLKAEVYRDLDIREVKDGLVLYAGPLAVPERKLWAGYTEPKQLSIFADNSRFDDSFPQDGERRVVVSTITIKKR